MNISDAIRQLEEIRGLYGEMSVKVPMAGVHIGNCGLDCYDDATFETLAFNGVKIVVVE